MKLRTSEVKPVILFDKKRANSYDKDICSFIPGYDLIHQSNLAILNEKSRDNHKILVIGAGTGKEAINLANSFSNSKITAVEPSKDMLDTFKEKLEATEINNIDLFEGYIADLEEQSFSFANSILVMHFLEDNGDKLHFLKEIYQRLKPMSELILVDFMKLEDECEDGNLVNAMRNHQLSISPDSSKIVDFHEKFKTNVKRITEERLFDLAEEAGFYKPVKFFQAFLVSGFILRK